LQPIVDADLVVLRKRRALRAPDPAAWFLMRRAADDLGERLAAVGRRFPRAAVFYSQTSAAAEALIAGGKVDEVLRVENDSALLGGDAGIVGEAERLPDLGAPLDLAVSLYALQDFNDIPGMLIQIRAALKPDGLFLGCLAGGATLTELRESLLAAETEVLGGASPRVTPFADVRDAGGLLQRAGFALPVADLETVVVRYDSMFALMRDLRAMGATSALHARSRRPATRALFFRAAEIYASRFADADGRVRATFQTIWLSGWAPHASQPKPLRPGSAKVSLARVLGNEGEK
jgi:hypothetical protein